MSGMSRILVPIYRLFLLAYPRDFREDSAEEMLETLRIREAVARSAASRSAGGALRMARFWFRELVSVLRTALSQRWKRLRTIGAAHPHRPVRPPRGAGAGSVFQDIRFGFRTLRRRPLFTLIAVGTLGLGIGATTVIFSVVDGVLLRNLDYERPEELVSIWMTYPQWEQDEILNEAWDKIGFSWPDYLFFRENTRQFGDVAIYRHREMTLTGAGDPARMYVGEASASLFPLLGVRAALGRTFLPGEEGPETATLAILSHSSWQTRFGSDPGIIGRTVTLDNRSFEVIGVLPGGFRLHSTLFKLFNSSLDSGERSLWVPVGFDGQSMRVQQQDLQAIGRLAPGASLDQARAEVDALLRGRQENSQVGFRLTSQKEEVVGSFRSPLLLLLAAAAALLLVACGNVATLLLSEATGRRHEMATRVAVGAGRLRIVRQLLTESVILGICGGVAGTLLATLGISGFLWLGPALPRIEEVGMNGTALGFSIVAGIVTGIVFGLAPAILLNRHSLDTSLRRGRRGIAAGRSLFQRGVVAAELALTMVLLVTGGLLVGSLAHLLRTDPGFDAQNLATVTVSPSQDRFPGRQGSSEFFDQAIQRIAAIPGVESVSGIDGLPFPGPVSGNTVTILGGPAEEDMNVMARNRIVLPDYHEVMGIPLLAGRTFTEADDASSEPVALINESMARRYWPDASPIGSRIDEGRYVYTVIGIVGDVRERHLYEEPQPMIYRTAAQANWRVLSLVARTAGESAGFVRLLRDAVWGVDPDAPITQESTVSALVAQSTGTERYRTLLVAAFGIAAMLLACVGVFGVTARSVARRSKEMGIRMALGARGRSLVSMVVSENAGTSALGVALGFAAALGVSRLLAGLLFGVESWDPLIYSAAALALLSLSLWASYVPARRATRIAPMEVLREE